MHKLVVLYSEPADPDHFRDYYVANHLPLVKEWPGPLAWRYSFDVAATEGEAPYFAVFEADFADAAAMDAAPASPRGRRLAAVVPNYATDAGAPGRAERSCRASPPAAIRRGLANWSPHDSSRFGRF